MSIKKCGEGMDGIEVGAQTIITKFCLIGRLHVAIHSKHEILFDVVEVLPFGRAGPAGSFDFFVYWYTRYNDIQDIQILWHS